MAPYRVTVVPPNANQVDLVIPANPQLTFREFLEFILQRASKHCNLSTTPETQITLRLGSQAGFLVDQDDKIGDVMTSADTLFVSISDTSVEADQDLAQLITPIMNQSQNEVSIKFRIRVITPLAAQRHEATRHIPLLRGGLEFNQASSLRKIRLAIADHLGLPLNDSDSTESNECNCKLAEQLVKRGKWDKVSCSGHIAGFGCAFDNSANDVREGKCAQCSEELSTHPTDINDSGQCRSYILQRMDLPCRHIVHAHCIEGNKTHWQCPDSCYSIEPTLPLDTLNVIVIAGKSKVEHMDIEGPDFASIKSALKVKFGETLEEAKCVHTKGGFENRNGIFLRLPFITICAHKRHKLIDPPGRNFRSLATEPRSVLDLHTSEAPIETSNLDMTVGETSLTHLIVGGVLTIYAVERRSTGKDSAVKAGQDAMFKAGPNWELPSQQSERGNAAFLSCLRVFAHLAGAEEFTDFQRNEILRLTHLLTKFPPTVRAMHILIDGKTLQPNESASLVQSISAVLQELIPKNLIENDSRRALEGTRLLLGLMLHRTRNQDPNETSNAVISSLAYLKGYHTVDLRDVKTNDPVTDPVQTSFGLMEKNIFLAFRNGGPLRFTPADSVGEMAANPDSRALRVARLFGGVAPEATYYDADVLGAELLSSMLSNSLAKELNTLSKDVRYLATICEETKLTVVGPRSLSSAQPPCLTLDRRGFMAVYTGAAACAPPDRDKAIFRPLTGAEENVDVNILAQLLEPILRDRERDGTNVFDLFSSIYQRKDVTPTELLVFCVDCSHSMDESSDFQELIDPQNEAVSTSSGLEDVHVEDEDDSPIEYNEMKDWMVTHESFQDMLALVHAGTGKRLVAQQILQFLRTLTSREITNMAKNERERNTWASFAYGLSNRKRQFQKKMDSLRRILSGLNLFEDSLGDLLIFQASQPDFQLDELQWRFGTPVPTAPRSSTSSAVIDVAEDCTIPQEFLCPIGQAVFIDPVTTSDNFTFERKSIERWYRIRASSPLTGLSVSDMSLRRNQQLYDQIQAWVQAQDITQATPSAPKRTRTSSRLSSKITLTFIAPTGTFSRTLSKYLSLANLHKIVYRGMRGVHARFSLYLNGRTILASQETLDENGIRNGSVIVANSLINSATNPTGALGVEQEMCLIKIYTPVGRGLSTEDLAYWVPRSTPVSLASVLFRFWRLCQRSWGAGSDRKDRSIWTDLKYGGDGVEVGQNHHHWDSMAALFENIPLKELDSAETMCQTDEPEPTGTNADESSDSSGHGDSEPYHEYLASPYAGTLYRTLKIELGVYVSPEEYEVRKLKKLRTLTRMGVSKQIFGSFINRLIAYNYPTVVGLVTFGSKATVTQPLTDIIENFRQAVDKMETRGDTTLWDSIALAADQLLDYGRKYPQINKRIICLSDGRDTKSKQKVSDVCRLLVQNSIVLDSFSIGGENNFDLRTLSFLTGGFKFVPKTLEEAVAICELEPVLSQDERPPSGRPVIPSQLTPSSFILAAHLATADVVTRDEFPKRSAHPNIGDTFVRVGAFGRTAPTAMLSGATDQTLSGLRHRRLLKEIRDIAINPHPSYDVYVSERNMAFWKVVLVGPSESAYSTGTFVLYLDMGDEYPRAAPKGRFVTSIFHPNINRHGRICHSIFDRNWTVDTTNRQVLDTVFGLLLVPEFTDPINTVVTLDYYWDEVAFKAEVEKHIVKHAAKNRELLGRQILGEE